MKLKVEHITEFEYDAPVHETATEVRLSSCDQPDAPQRLLDFALTVTPAARVTHYTDFYGNVVHHFNILHSLQKLQIKAEFTVLTGSGETPATVHEETCLLDFLSESRYVRLDDEIRAFAAAFLKTRNPLDAAQKVCRSVFERFVYEPGVTDVHSTTQEVMATGRGVCQDFAHVMIAVCRSLGTPARYVSGYLWGGSGTEEHDRASHAWCEVRCGANGGWVGFDPTHETLLVDERYIRIGTGRDYGDVTLVRGTFKGNARETLTATVRVQAVG